MFDRRIGIEYTMVEAILYRGHGELHPTAGVQVLSLCFIDRKMLAEYTDIRVGGRAAAACGHTAVPSFHKP